ncbi:MAG: glycosyltransferase, partial [Clostridiales bacterium]|nr:glycosyltransferase [Clostridiales bacterium]
MCRVDVIMATYNGEKYVSEQVVSVLKNHGVEVYLHVFDDGSTDKTIEILQSLRQQYPRHLSIYQNEHNLGVTKNFLCGIRKVMEHNHEAKYFMCCDQDDAWNQDKIVKTLKRMKQMEKRYGVDRPLLVFTDAMVADRNLNEIHPSFYKIQHLQVHKTDLPHLLMENKCIGCTIMINRSFEPYLWEVPNHARYHDWWLALIASTFGNISFLS